jgi:hypothetical protein
MLRTMVSSENASITRLRGVTDPLARAKECEEYLTRGREVLAVAQQMRDEAIREARRNGAGTVDQIAAHIGVKRNIVVDALRGPK